MFIRESKCECIFHSKTKNSLVRIVLAMWRQLDANKRSQLTFKDAIVLNNF